MARQFSRGRLSELMATRQLGVNEFERQLARLGTPISKATISRHLSGEHLPSPDLLGIYADFFQVMVDSFYTETSDVPDPVASGG